MTNSYYCLVAGLTEYTLESDRKGFDAIDIRRQIAEELAPSDLKSMEMLYTFYDIENIIARHNGKDNFNPLGNIAREQIDNKEYPEFIGRIVRGYAHLSGEVSDEDESESVVDADIPFETALWDAFYAHCEASKCNFIASYFDFDKTLRNICTAFTARSKGITIAPQLVGSGEVVTALSKSSASDFGLRNEIEYVDSVISLLEMRNIIEKEHRLDTIRWDKADDITTFNYFDINIILAYLVKVNIIHRWVALDYNRGRDMLQKLLGELSDKEILRRAEEGETK